MYPWNKGKKLSKDIRNKIKKNNAKFWEGKERDIETRTKISNTLKKKKIKPPSQKGIKPSIESRKKNSDSHKGSKSHLWKGGKTELNLQIRSLFEMKLWRSQVFERDDWTCQTCFRRNTYLEAHHIKRLSDIIDKYKIRTIQGALKCKKLWDITIGVTLCKDCHNLTKGRIKNEYSNQKQTLGI